MTHCHCVALYRLHLSDHISHRLLCSTQNSVQEGCNRAHSKLPSSSALTDLITLIITPVQSTVCCRRCLTWCLIKQWQLQCGPGQLQLTPVPPPVPHLTVGTLMCAAHVSHKALCVEISHSHSWKRGKDIVAVNWKSWVLIYSDFCAYVYIVSCDLTAEGFCLFCFSYPTTQQCGTTARLEVVSVWEANTNRLSSASCSLYHSHIQ